MARKFLEETKSSQQRGWTSSKCICNGSAYYSPNPNSNEMGVDLPFDLKTGEILQNVWNRWLSWDPVRMVGKYSKNLRRLKFIYFDCGTKR